MSDQAEQALNAALALHQGGDNDGAETAYRAILAEHPNHAETQYFLGLVLHQKNAGAAAVDALTRACALAPSVAAYHAGLGLALAELGEAAAATTAFLRASTLAPGNAWYLNDLGVQLKALGDIAEARNVFEKARQLAPSEFGPTYNLGNLLLDIGDPAEAVTVYHSALAIAPDSIDARLNLATAYQKIGRLDDAEAAIQPIFERAPEHAVALNNLGNISRARGDADRARDLFARAVATDPNSADIVQNLGTAEIDRGDVAAARQAYNRALILRPETLKTRWFDALSLPVVYDSEAQIEDERERWMVGLTRLEAELRLDSEAEIADALATIGESCNFALAYQGRDDRDAQRRYAHLVERIVAAAFPACAVPPTPPARVKPKVLFVSAFLRDHTVARLFDGWLRHLDRERFTVEAMITTPDGDVVTDDLACVSDAFHRDIPDVTGLVDRVISVRPDAIVYLDIGMDPRTQVLAGLRLAPVQVVAFGHPVTTGFSNIDAFISGALQEPEGAAEHYVETLVQLPGLGVTYPRPAVSASAVPVDVRPVFLCTQSLFKLLPGQDAAFVDLARAVPDARFRFIAHGKAAVTQRFRRRLADAFKINGLDADEHLEIVPQCPRSEFLALHHDVTAVLDSFGWSGGNTSFEALAMSVPVVTLAGEFMRGRVTAAMYERMGMSDQVATDTDDWVNRARCWATQPQVRADVVDSISAATAELFDDERPVIALSDFLESMIADARVP